LIARSFLGNIFQVKKEAFWHQNLYTSDISVYTYDIRKYLGKDTGATTYDITATHYTVTNLTRKLQGV